MELLGKRKGTTFGHANEGAMLLVHLPDGFAYCLKVVSEDGQAIGLMNFGVGLRKPGDRPEVLLGEIAADTIVIDCSEDVFLDVSPVPAEYEPTAPGPLDPGFVVYRPDGEAYMSAARVTTFREDLALVNLRTGKISELFGLSDSVKVSRWWLTCDRDQREEPESPRTGSEGTEA